MSEYKCPKCNSTNLFTKKKDTQTGLYCKDCGRWIKWLNKDEARTFETDTNVGNKWISVKDRLPDDNQTVVTYSSTGEAEVLTYDNHYIKDTFVKYDGAIRVFNVTHWMPLPEPPKED